MAAGKLTSRFGDGNSSDGGSWDRGPFGGGNFRFLSWSPFLLLPSTPHLSPSQRQVIIWTNAGILLNGPLGTNISEILIETLTFSFKKMHLNVLSAKWRPFLFGLNVFKGVPYRCRVYYFPYPQSILHITGYYNLNWLTHCDLVQPYD